MWIIAWQIIPTRSVIGKRINIEKKKKEFMLCETQEATLEHIIIHCLIAKSFEMHFNSICDPIKQKKD